MLHWVLNNLMIIIFKMQKMLLCKRLCKNFISSLKIIQIKVYSNNKGTEYKIKK